MSFKRFIFGFLACALLFTAAGCNSDRVDEILSLSSGGGRFIYDASDIAEAPVSDFSYIVSDSAVSIKSYNGTASRLAIPAEIDGMKVQKILPQAFYCNTSLEAIIIPDGVTRILDEVFYGCTSLLYVQLPSNLVSLGESAFSECSALNSVVFPSKITEIPNRCFYGCTSLESVTMDKNVTSFGDYCFAGCTSIFGMTLSENIVKLGEFAFYQCSGLSGIEFSGDDTDFQRTTFLECPDLIIYASLNGYSYCLAQEYGYSVKAS